ncbi:MAG TPA: hypothetical protein PKB03_07145, partial [Baekduia sp.]|nr:hypothetical protein [Baekduia sp.]
ARWARAAALGSARCAIKTERPGRGGPRNPGRSVGGCDRRAEPPLECGKQIGLDLAAARSALDQQPPADRPQLYGDGQAGARVVAELESL